MKKILLLFAFASMALISCSSSDDDNKSQSSFVKFTINGVQKNFNSVVVNVNDDYDWDIYYEVVATVNNNPSEILYFEVKQNTTGVNANYTFNYTVNGNTYALNASNANLSMIVTANTDKKLAGTFSGSLGYYSGNNQGGDSVELLNGSFDINF